MTLPVHRVASPLVAFAFCLSLARLEPQCQETTPLYYEHPEYTCSEFQDQEDFAKFIPRGLKNPKVEFVLKDGRLSHIPPGAFGGNKVSGLVFNNVTVDSFVSPTGLSVFDELEGTLEKIVFYKGSSVPKTWDILKNLKRLDELVFFRMSKLNLGKDFNGLPGSVKKVAVIQSSLSDVDKDWMSSLINLEQVRIESSDLKTFSRSMLPRPAPHLRELTITRTALASLPMDFSQELPALRMLNLGRNKITTIGEGALAPLTKQTTIVVLSGNPMNCDCKLRFLLGYPDTWQYPKCKTPDALAKTPVKGLTPDKLGCHDGGSHANP